MSASPALNEETIGSNEAELIGRIVAMQRQLHERAADDDQNFGPTKRGQHPKQHGLVQGELTVEPNLPDELAHGVFSRAGSYPIWMRFSLGRGHTDTRKTLHGCAMKVTGLEGGREQDFVMVDHPVFFIKDLEEYVALFEAQVSGRMISFFLGWNPFDWHLSTLLRMRAAAKSVGNLLGVRYYSTTPYRLGPHAIKFGMTPHAENGPNTAQGSDDDYLGKRLADHFREKGSGFDLRVLRQRDPRTMPVEDPTVDWEKAAGESAWQKVATVKLPPQESDSEERRKQSETMAFSPWNTLDEHRPLGAINRARREVYQALSEDRMQALAAQQNASS